MCAAQSGDLADGGMAAGRARSASRSFGSPVRGGDERARGDHRLRADRTHTLCVCGSAASAAISHPV